MAPRFPRQLILVLAVGCLAAVLGYFAGMGSGTTSVEPSSTPSAPGPSAAVNTVAIRKTRIEETIHAYGTVVPAPGRSVTFNIPFECSVDGVLVGEGQRVRDGDVLIVVRPSPNTTLAFEQSKVELQSARELLALLQRQVDLKLATRQDLSDAEHRVRAATLQVQSFEARDVDGPREVRATSDGVVSALDVRPGQIVPAGDRLLETVGEQYIQVLLGIESEDVDRIQAGQPVTLTPVNAAGTSSFEGVVDRVTRRVDPATRLVDLYVTPAAGTTFLLHDAIRGSIVVASNQSLVVPRTAVRPDEGSHILYCVVDEHAVRHEIEIGIESDRDVEIFGEGLSEGMAVVVTGQSVLTDGMRVRVVKDR